jgi:hypothetical protein
MPAADRRTLLALHQKIIRSVAGNIAQLPAARGGFSADVLPHQPGRHAFPAESDIFSALLLAAGVYCL